MQPSPEAVPACVGIIMDGNRRWARARGLPTLEGHRAGLDRVKPIIRHAYARGVTTAVLYAFSTENWNRSAEEVGYLMKLFVSAIERELADIMREGVRVRFIGDLARLAPELREAALRLERESAENEQGTLVLALSYGGRAEIVDAARRAAAAGPITEETLRAHMWSADIPDPDLIVRTSGEKRLSGFLLWQSAYSELFFSDTLWPDFSEGELDRILAEYAARERRHGK